MDWLPQLTMRAAIQKSDAAQNAHGTGISKKNALLGSKYNPGPGRSPTAQRWETSTVMPASLHLQLIAHPKMTLSEIYQWICDNFPYYREAGSGWKVRILFKFLFLYCEQEQY